MIKSQSMNIEMDINVYIKMLTKNKIPEYTIN